MNDGKTNFIQQNSPDGGFLQSPEWRKFQKDIGKKTHNISSDNFFCNILEHNLPIVGKYFYIPRGPIMSWNMEHGTWNENVEELIRLAKENNVGWIRIEPATNEILQTFRGINKRVIKAPYDMQPKEILVLDISVREEEILAQMKQKTRYNIKLAQKKGVDIFCSEPEQRNKYAEDFVRLVEITSKRNNIVSHQGGYYKLMLQAIPDHILKLYLARYQGKIIAANIVAFFGGTATYLHGASDDQYKNIMAPFFLQWQQIRDAKAAGCKKYDLGGVKINSTGGKSWVGVTRFKTGFSPDTKPTEFPGAYDIIINPVKYWIYRLIQRVKSLI